MHAEILEFNSSMVSPRVGHGGMVGKPHLGETDFNQPSTRDRIASECSADRNSRSYRLRSVDHQKAGCCASLAVSHGNARCNALSTATPAKQIYPLGTRHVAPTDPSPRARCYCPNRRYAEPTEGRWMDRRNRVRFAEYVRR